MSERSRKKNSIINSAFGLLNNIIHIFFAFYLRKKFVEIFSPEYLGLYSFFDSIFGMLIALDCGVSSSIFFQIYEPIAKKDRRHIVSIFNLIKIIYTLRSILVLLIGFIISFYLKSLLKGTDLSFHYIIKCYNIYMIFNSANYFFVFYSFYLEALQKRFVTSIIQIVTYVLEVTTKILSIFIFKSFILYLICSVIFILITNITCMVYVYKKEPYLLKKSKIEQGDLKNIKKLFGMALHSLSAVISRYTDTFLISSLTGLVNTGIFTNYKTINTNVTALLNQITSSIKDPFRNYIICENRNKVETMLNDLNYMIFILASVCASCIFCLSNDFIVLWLGDSFLLSQKTVLFMTLTFEMSFMNYFIIDCYYLTQSYYKDKKSPLIELSVNFIVSLLLGLKYGILGIMIGTVLYYFVQTILLTKRLYKYFFNKSCLKILLKQLFFFLISIGVALLLNFIYRCIFIHITVLNFLLKIIFTVVLSVMLIVLLTMRIPEFIYFKTMVVKVVLNLPVLRGIKIRRDEIL